MSERHSGHTRVTRRVRRQTLSIAIAMSKNCERVLESSGVLDPRPCDRECEITARFGVDCVLLQGDDGNLCECVGEIERGEGKREHEREDRDPAVRQHLTESLHRRREGSADLGRR